MRRGFVIGSFVSLGYFGWLVATSPRSMLAWMGLAVVVALSVRGWVDFFQTRHAVRRNFPLVGNFRYLFEAIRPEINQYFVESDTDGRPFNRNTRSVVYQRAKSEPDTLPFGTRLDVYEVGYEWLNHSLAPVHVDPASLRVDVGGPQCLQPYSASIFNISAMSYGSLSRNAILALNGGAKLGGFAHDTGEGGLSPFHLQPGGDLVWQIGTGYFCARTIDGQFSPEAFQKRAQYPQVKMIELKLSQGAKPGHGGILPAAKVTPEIAEIRGVAIGKDCNSPPGHTAFSTPIGMMKFIEQLRALSGGKPVGLKLAVGKRREFLSLCKAMIETNVLVDFITVDGGEGGTGAAPHEFSDSVGTPLTEALVFVHNALVGFGLRKHIRVFCSGRVVTGADVIKRLALGADACNSARAMMLALGCIQALRCNTNKCPTGVATQDPSLVVGLDVGDKTKRVAAYHRETVRSVAELIGAMGVTHTRELRPWHVLKRTDFAETKNLSELFEYIEEGSLLGGAPPPSFARALASARTDTFAA